MMNFGFSRGGQVWIETVLYTLIGLALMGVVLSFVVPKINEARDRAMVEQSIGSMNDLDAKIEDALGLGVGNSREMDITFKKGELFFNTSSGEIVMTLKGLTKPYSEPDVEISIGRAKVISVTDQKTSTTKIKLAYGVELRYGGKSEDWTLFAAPTPYKLLVSYKSETVNNVERDYLDVTDLSGR